MKIYKNTKGAFVLEMSRDEATDMQHLISTAADCSGLMFGIENSDECLGKRGYEAAVRLTWNEAERLESLAASFEPIADELHKLVKLEPIRVTS